MRGEGGGGDPLTVKTQSSVSSSSMEERSGPVEEGDMTTGGVADGEGTNRSINFRK